MGPEGGLLVAVCWDNQMLLSRYCLSHTVRSLFRCLSLF